MGRVGYSKIADAKEAELLTDGPNMLRIVKAEHGEGTVKGKYRTQIIMDCPEQPDRQSVFLYLGDPATLDEYLVSRPDKGQEDWVKSEDFKTLNTRRFLEAFQIPYDDEGFDTDDFMGRTALIPTYTEKDDKGVDRVNLTLPELRG